MSATPNDPHSEPPEPIALRTGRAGSLTGAHRPNGVDGGADDADVDTRVQGSQAGGVDMRRGPEIVHRLAVDDHTDVDPLTPVDPRNRV
jgi:hypothetical protein